MAVVGVPIDVHHAYLLDGLTRQPMPTVDGNPIGTTLHLARQHEVLLVPRHQISGGDPCVPVDDRIELRLHPVLVIEK